MYQVTALLLVTLVLATTSPAAQTPRPTPASRITALVGGTLIDGFGGRPVRNSVILIDGERISAVGVQGTLAIPANAEVISTEGMSVLPGLWDMHVHLMLNGHSDYPHWDKTYPPLFESTIMPAGAKQLLLAGVTSARDLGAPLRASISVRDRINAGTFEKDRDQLYGAPGNDKLNAVDDDGNDNLNGGPGIDTCNGDIGADFGDVGTSCEKGNLAD